MAIGAIPRARRLAASAAVAALFGATLLPVAGQAATSYAWQPGAGAVSGATIYGRITSPTNGDSIQAGKINKVQGWAYDPSSAIDSVQVWANGGPDSGGMMVGQGTEGATSVEAADGLGTDAALKSGFSVTLNNDALAFLQAGAQSTLFVGVHSKANGWWMKSVVVNVMTPLRIEFQNQPINVIMFPINDQRLSQNGINKSNNTGPTSTFFGYALDQNLLVNPDADPGNAAGKAGVNRVQLWLDGGRDTGTCLAGCGVGPNMGKLIVSQPQWPFAGTASTAQEAAYNDGQGAAYAIPQPGALYGRIFDRAGWSYTLNLTSIPTGQHTLTVYARSSITGAETMSQSSFIIEAPRA